MHLSKKILRSQLAAVCLLVTSLLLSQVASAQNSNAGLNAGKAAYDKVDQMPQAPYDISQFLAKTIHYPEKAKKKHLEGRVVLKFIVDKNGNVVDPKVLRSPDQLLSDEALRAVSLMPKWQPGEKEGKKVNVYFTLPVVFKLS